MPNMVACRLVQIEPHFSRHETTATNVAKKPLIDLYSHHRRASAWFASMAETSAAADPAEKKQKTDPPAVSKCLLLQYDYVEGILEKRAPHRAGHLAHWKRLADASQVLLGGAFDPPSGAVIVLRGIERDEVEALVKEDPYVANGLVPSYVIKEWNVVLGSAI
ncbi:unnamed protein product [Symbiodinium natans]|uniref:YCII-related domain-containing protein n=1 Tax=Symbiodinium natans TaxID=878477 RepID=A0A812QSB3_9DINO|nr:unnamed protein product [Symbiodinium natans]